MVITKKYWPIPTKNTDLVYNSKNYVNGFGDQTDSYVVIQSELRSTYVLIRSMYVLYENKYLGMYFMTILLCGNCTSSYKSDEIVRFSALWLWDVGFLEIEKGFFIWHRFDFTYSILDYCFRVYFGTATYVDYLTFSHLNPITNLTPRPNATLTIGATARNPNYRGSRVYPNYRASCTQP